MNQSEKAETFAALHQPGAPLILYNIWDAGSARVVAEAGAKAVATGSVSVAGAQGFPDGQAIPLDLLLTVAERITASVDLPVTVDFEGAYSGGLIVPGVNLSLKALHEAAAKLPNVDVARPQKVVGDDTIACIQSGVYWGYVSLIEGVCKRISDEVEAEMTVIATGGLSALFATGTDAIHHVDGDVTTRGLVKIYKENLS